MKRVVIYSTNYFPEIGGAEIAIKEITDRIDDVEFVLITTRLSRALPAHERIGNVEVYRVGIGGNGALNKLLSPFLGALKTYQLTRKNKPNVFWAIMVTYTSGAPYLYNLIPFLKRVPIVLTLQEGDSEEHLRHRHFGLIHLSWKLALRYAEVVTVISTYLKERAERLGFKGKMSVIPNGVDGSTFSESAAQIFNKKEGTKLLITTSRLVEKNGVDVLIKALSLLPKHIELLIVGDGPLRNELEKTAQNLEVSERVHFIGGVPYEDIASYLSVSDIFIRPSRSEGMGNSFIEAMASGVPVIGTQEGGISDFLFDPERNPDKEPTGLSVSVDSPKEVARQVGRYLDDDELRKRVIINAKAFVKESYDWNTIARRMKEEVFLPLLSGHQKSV